jgi:hypothetical protein
MALQVKIGNYLPKTPNDTPKSMPSMGSGQISARISPESRLSPKILNNHRTNLNEGHLMETITTVLALSTEPFVSAAYLTGVALFYLVMQRTLKHRAATSFEGAAL